jgi:hypothetical protein
MLVHVLPRFFRLSASRRRARLFLGEAPERPAALIQRRAVARPSVAPRRRSRHDDQRPVTIAGVLPEDFDWLRLSPGARWIFFMPAPLEMKDWGNTQLVGRLKPGVTAAAPRGSPALRPADRGCIWRWKAGRARSAALKTHVSGSLRPMLVVYGRMVRSCTANCSHLLSRGPPRSPGKPCGWLSAPAAAALRQV